VADVFYVNDPSLEAFEEIKEHTVPDTVNLSDNQQALIDRLESGMRDAQLGDDIIHTVTNNVRTAQLAAATEAGRVLSLHRHALRRARTSTPKPADDASDVADASDEERAEITRLRAVLKEATGR
jgi:hypothetical protein